ncbi:MAG: Rne/Rng family ribonuclease [Ignavibacteria bacterium]|jgi:ribonuclease G|nr:Rne/Rng family ribonuclease [Ignavibacteria bacterium]
MRKEIIINSTINEVRVAITEDGHLAELYIEVPEKEKLLGNVYYGKVNKVVTGINAAFIDIGLQQDAFLHFSDFEETNNINFDNNDDDIATAIVDEASNDADDASNISIKKPDNVGNITKEFAKFSTKSSGDIVINLQENKEILVQVVREAYSHKGMKVGTKIAIPGRYVVLLPFERMIGISRKIRSHHERNRLRKLARKALPEGFGCIIRTASVGKKEEELISDWENLLLAWSEAEKKIEYARKQQTPMLIYQDMLLADSVIRDLFKDDISRVVIDSKVMFKNVISYLETAAPNLVNKVEYYTGIAPIFEVLGIEKELARTTKRVLPLTSGGDIVIDKAEALTVIDVNSGRSNETDQEKNALKTNLEATREIARQLRLRDIGGIIIVDFIDMQSEQNKRQLLNEVRNEIRHDKAKVVAYPLTQLGLMQITRQRINQNLGEKISDICPTCSGSGRIPSKSTLLNSIEKWLKTFRQKSNEFKITLLVHPQIAEYLTEGNMPIISRLMIKYFIKINVQQNDSIGIDKFRVISNRKQKDITQEFL